MLKDDVFLALEESKEQPVSGQELADRFGVSRNAVWKVVNQLKKEGHIITSDRVLGYALSENSDVLNASSIRKHITTRSALSVLTVEEIDSTNNEAKRRLGQGDGRDILIVADHQTGGRGRMGHTFFSPAGTGIYMTLSIDLSEPLYKPERITLAAAVAVVRVLGPYLSEKPKLKWVNDIFYKGKKVAGILSEAISDLETGLIQHVIVGIGLNVRPMEFPEDLIGIAGSLDLDRPSRSEIVGRITEELLKLYSKPEDDGFLSEYLEYSMHPEKVKEELGLR